MSYQVCEIIEGKGFRERENWLVRGFLTHRHVKGATRPCRQ